MFAFITSRRKTPSGRVFSASLCAGLLDLARVVAEIRHPQIFLEHSAVGMRIGAHPAIARRR